MREAQLFEVSHPERDAVQVEAADRLRAIAAAARVWGDRWTEIARGCEVRPLGPAPAAAQHPQGARRIRNAAEPRTAAQHPQGARRIRNAAEPRTAARQTERGAKRKGAAERK